MAEAERGRMWADDVGDDGDMRRHRAAVPREVIPSEIQRQIHGSSALGRFNNWLALKVTQVVGTMWAAYVFTAIALVSLPGAIEAFREGDMVVAVGWLSTSFLQLVLLPIIIVGQKVISAHQDARAETDHDTLTELHAINIQQLEILQTQERILEELRKRRAADQTA